MIFFVIYLFDHAIRFVFCQSVYPDESRLVSLSKNSRALARCPSKPPLFVLTVRVISVPPSSVLCASSISTTEHVVCWVCWIPSVFPCTFPPWGLTRTVVHMNTLQRAWIFQGWCKNAFRGRFLMLLLERAPSDFAEVFIVSAPRHPRSWKKEWWRLRHPPLRRCSLDFDRFFGGNFTFFLLFFRTHWWVWLQLGNDYLLTRWTMLAKEAAEILSACICLCPSSPTTSQSFVMHVRWSIYGFALALRSGNVTLEQTSRWCSETETWRLI